MAPLLQRLDPSRLRAGAAAAALHILLGYVLITGLGGTLVPKLGESLKVYDVPAPLPPPPPEPVPAEVKVQAAEGAAAPPSLRARPSPVVAPPPKVRIKVKPPLTAAPAPSPVTGNDPSAGASEIDGPGTGAGGEGAGTGAGTGGTGGGSGLAVRARRVSGSISGAADYPPAARRAGMEGSVVVRFTVRPDGSVGGCTVTRSNAGPELEATTCALIERRFRYESARDSAGRPVSEVVSRTFDWLLPSRR